MPDETLDANQQTSASSTDADANQDADSSTAQTSKLDLEKGLQDVVKDVLKKSDAQSDQDKQPDKEADAEEPDKQTEEQDDQKSDDQKEQEAKGPVPYERFSEVNKAKVEFEQQLEQSKPLVEAQRSIIDHCEQHNISPDEFSYWLNVAALAQVDPAKALETLQPKLQALQSYTGDVLPADLKEAVDAGEISLAMAKRVAAAESKMKFGEQRSALTQQQMAAQQQQQFVQTMNSALGNWMNTKRSSDPDFAPKQGEEPDGKQEMFIAKFAMEAKSANIKSVQDLINVAEKVYASVDASLKRYAPRSNGQRVIKSSQSIVQGRLAPKTLEEVVASRAAAHGITFTPRKVT
mgnify:CR=1 FL=1